MCIATRTALFCALLFFCLGGKGVEEKKTDRRIQTGGRVESDLAAAPCPENR